MADGLRVDMLPAGDGDGLWIEWGSKAKPHRMIIDGGRKGAERFLRQRLTELPTDQRDVDLLVITHIDADHIGAPIELLLSPVPNVTFKDVWFNDYHQLIAAGNSDEELTRGPAQGEALGMMLEYRNLDWNKAFDGRAVVVDEPDELPRRSLPGGLELVLLSPTQDKLTRLATEWRKSLGDDRTPGDRADALRRLESFIEHQEEPVPPVDATRGRAKKWGADHSAANGSSIAFIAEYENERWLFAGDAHEDVLRAGLHSYGAGSPVPLTGFKVSHHGSMNSISPELLDVIDCDRYLISTNGGGRNKHPDTECVELIVEKSEKPEVVFNYLTKYTERWANEPDVTATFLYNRNHEPLDSINTAVYEPVGDAGGGGEQAEDAEVSKAKLEVEVVWGDISMADDEVLAVGHYVGVLPQNAELSLERLVSDIEDPWSTVAERNEAPEEYEKLIVTAMTRRNMISGRLGQVTYLPVKGEEGRLVAICGMGPAGSFSLAKLRLLYRNLAWSLISFPEPRNLGTVLIGAGVSGATANETVRAMVNGFGEALRPKPEENGSWRVRVVELEKRRAETILKVLRELSNDESLVVDLNVVPTIHEGDGRRASPEYAVGVIIDAVTKLEPKPIRDLDEILAAIPPDQFEITGLKEDITWLWELGGNSAAQLVREALGVGELEPGESQTDRGLLKYPTRFSFLADTDVLRATVLTKNAAVPERVIGTDRGLIAEAARRMSRAKNAEVPSLGALLHRLIIPRDFREHLSEAGRLRTPLLFEVDRHTALVHWEMLAADVDAESPVPVGLCGPVARQLRTGHSATAGLSRRKGKRLQALVIGDPARPPDNLEGARQEAYAVAEFFQQLGRFDEVEVRIGAPGTNEQDTKPADRIEVLGLLLQGDIDVVHYAGHGNFDLQDPHKTGWLFPDGLLTARELERVDNAPTVVFANACLTSRTSDASTTGDLTKPYGEEGLLPSLADEFFSRGVRNYIGTAWEVSDDGAIEFALEFYERFFVDREDMGSALFETRRSLRRRELDEALWAAYQHYGDPGFRYTDL